MTLTGESWNTHRETCSKVTVSTTDHAKTYLTSNLDLCTESLVTDCLNHDMAPFFIWLCVLYKACNREIFFFIIVGSLLHIICYECTWVYILWNFMKLKTTHSSWSGLWCAMVAIVLLRAAWVSVLISVVLRFLLSGVACHQCCMLYIPPCTSVSLIMLVTIIHVPWRAAVLLEKMINMCCLALMILICTCGKYLLQKVKVGFYWYSFTGFVTDLFQNASVLKVDQLWIVICTGYKTV